MRKKLPEEVEGARSALNSESVDDALRFIVDAHEKFHLFQGHRIRVSNQRKALDKLMKGIEDECLSTKKNSIFGVFTIDWKMKFDEMRQREASTHFYGKRGISWHIGDIAYCVWDVDTETVKWLHGTLSQILENENKQDGLAVLSVVEAMMKKVSHEIPHLKYAYLRTDNAGCYHKKELTLGIPLLNAMSKGIKIYQASNAETQDGKTGKCDGYGATATRHCKRRLTCRENATEYNKVCTPLQLATTLAEGGGLQNSGVQLVKLDRTGQLAAFVKRIEKCSVASADFFSRANERWFFPEKGM
jgi:hypothetical protein